MFLLYAQRLQTRPETRPVFPKDKIFLTNYLTLVAVVLLLRLFRMGKPPQTPVPLQVFCNHPFPENTLPSSRVPRPDSTADLDERSLRRRFSYVVQSNDHRPAHSEQKVAAPIPPEPAPGILTGAPQVPILAKHKEVVSGFGIQLLGSLAQTDGSLAPAHPLFQAQGAGTRPDPDLPGCLDDGGHCVAGTRFGSTKAISCRGAEFLRWGFAFQRTLRNPPTRCGWSSGFISSSAFRQNPLPANQIKCRFGLPGHCRAVGLSRVSALYRRTLAEN